MAKFIVGHDTFTQALFESGVIKEEPENVRRIIIDLEAGSIGRIYVETFADDEKLSAALDAGIRVEQATAEPGELR